MPRIRSVHPGQWSDEDFVSCSAFARLLAIGLRNIADDNGVFEWKPIGIKMKVFPADDVQAAELLQELIATNQVTRYETAGKSYGAIRNFRQYQRPQKPKPIYPLPDELRAYVGLSDSGTRPVRDSSATDNGKSPQRKEVGGNTELSNDNSSPPSPDDIKTRLFGEGLKWLAERSNKPSDKLRPLVGKWIKGHGEAEVLAAFLRAYREAPVDPLGWITKALQGQGPPEAERRVDEMVEQATDEWDKRHGNGERNQRSGDQADESRGLEAPTAPLG